ncbi:MAG: hypothetical protein HYS26_03450 [Candidatus Kaiserbacteria bacterium]|nr:MAG: hypothetical protein HYS26_03450 [Candidatus Kaiserbacteria bacterium]
MRDRIVDLDELIATREVGYGEGRVAFAWLLTNQELSLDVCTHIEFLHAPCYRVARGIRTLVMRRVAMVDMIEQRHAVRPHRLGLVFKGGVDPDIVIPINDLVPNQTFRIISGQLRLREMVFRSDFESARKRAPMPHAWYRRSGAR